MSERPRVVARKPVYEGWNSLEIATVEAADPHGETKRHDREVIDHGDAAVVMTIDRERDVAVLVRQWRAPLLVKGDDPFLLEACAGIIDPGETPEATARREAKEEIGAEIGELTPVAAVLPSAGTLTERMHLFVADVARSDRISAGGGNPGEGEDIEIVEIPLRDLFDMARSGAIEDAKTLILVQHLLIAHLDETIAGAAR